MIRLEGHSTEHIPSPKPNGRRLITIGQAPGKAFRVLPGRRATLLHVN